MFRKIWKGIRVAVRILAGLNRADVIDINEAEKMEKGVNVIEDAITDAKSE